MYIYILLLLLSGIDLQSRHRTSLGRRIPIEKVRSAGVVFVVVVHYCCHWKIALVWADSLRAQTSGTNLRKRIGNDRQNQPFPSNYPSNLTVSSQGLESMKVTLGKHIGKLDFSRFFTWAAANALREWPTTYKYTTNNIYWDQKPPTMEARWERVRSEQRAEAYRAMMGTN